MVYFLYTLFVTFFRKSTPRQPRRVRSGPFRHKKRPPPRRPREHYAVPFSVEIEDALVDDSDGVSSCIRVPRSSVLGAMQLEWKKQRKLFRERFQSQYMWAPGTNFALVNSSSGPSYNLSRMMKAFSVTVLAAGTKSLTALPTTVAFETKHLEFCSDSGANSWIVNDERFLENIVSASESVKGVGGSRTITTSKGDLLFSIVSDDGTSVFERKVMAYFVPSCPYNLMPESLWMDMSNVPEHITSIVCKGKGSERCRMLQWIGKDGKLKKLSMPVSDNNLFFFSCAPRTNDFYNFVRKKVPYMKALNVNVIPTDDNRESNDEPNLVSTIPSAWVDPSLQLPNIVEATNEDFEPPPEEPVMTDFAVLTEDSESEGVSRKELLQDELMSWHERLSHASFATLKLMAKAKVIPSRLAAVDPPVCPGCAYGKQHRTPWRTKGFRNIKKIKEATAPGQVVSVDHMQTARSTPGFIPRARGPPRKDKYEGAVIFVDHFSDFTYVHLVKDLKIGETLEAKQAFERLSRSHGVVIKHYHCDNGRFADKKFVEECERSGQTISFCGVNAHHQNGRAEKKIRDLTDAARTALLHARHRWPQAIPLNLWPCALKHVTNTKNALPRNYKPATNPNEDPLYETSPLSKFSGTTVEPNLKHFHPFGCPVYVLEDSIQGPPFVLNRWKDRSRLGIFMQHSPLHATNIGLILNTKTGCVSPQFHCLYDDAFASVRRDVNAEQIWRRQLSDISAEPSKDLSATTDTAVNLPTNHFVPRTFAVPFNPATSSEGETERTSRPTQPTSTEVEPSNVLPTPSQQQNGTTTEPDRQNNDTAPTNLRRSQRSTPSVYKSITAFAAKFYSLDSKEVEIINHIPSENDYNPLVFFVEAMAASSDPDTMHLHEAMAQSDRAEFLKAMEKELADHIARKHWKVVPLSEVPTNRKPIPMVWSFKRKRNPIGEIVKYKARLCAGGHKQIHGVDFWSTYSPVVSWTSVRLMLILALLQGWHINSIDFVLAFPQAPVQRDTFMSPPRVPNDFKIPDLPNPADRSTKVYKLLKNLYGLKDAGKTWFEYIKKGLISRGWKACEQDPCLFTKGKVILVLYVDDAVLLSPSLQDIKREIVSLQEEFTLTDEGPINDYLGVRFDRKPDGSIELCQPRIIERALNLAGISEPRESKMHDTPADAYKQIHRDENGPPRVQTWNYRQLVGCLNYIRGTRPDIEYAVHQCSRYCIDPRRSHEEAVKRICRYLKRTKDRGLIMRPDKTKGLECFVDADWAGNWTPQTSHDPLSATSRTGFVITFAGCPIVWGSRMQSLIALSTTEAEYIALSTALREVLAIMNLVNELKLRGIDIPIDTPKVRCRVWEDNAACLELANNPKSRPRTKHLSVRLHHFRSYVKSKLISIRHVSTKEQIADIFTKPLPRDQFIYLRDKLMGWNDSSRHARECENIHKKVTKSH